MTNYFECSIQAGEETVFGAIADVVQKYKDSDVRLWGVKVSVNPSRFGVDEAISLRLKSPAGEAEIGKFLVRPVTDSRYLLIVPHNRTGGAEPPELDTKGSYFDRVLNDLLGRLAQLGIYVPPSPPQNKEPIGFRRPE